MNRPRTDMEAVGQAIEVLRAQRDEDCVEMIGGASKYYDQVVSLTTVMGLYDDLVDANKRVAELERQAKRKKCVTDAP